MESKVHVRTQDKIRWSLPYMPSTNGNITIACNFKFDVKQQCQENRVCLSLR